MGVEGAQHRRSVTRAVRQIYQEYFFQMLEIKKNVRCDKDQWWWNAYRHATSTRASPKRCQEDKPRPLRGVTLRRASNRGGSVRSDFVTSSIACLRRGARTRKDALHSTTRRHSYPFSHSRRFCRVVEDCGGRIGSVQDAQTRFSKVSVRCARYGTEKDAPFVSGYARRIRSAKSPCA